MLFPARYTARPEHWPSDGHMLIEFAQLVFTNPDGSALQLDDWQSWLLVEILKRYPKDYEDPLLAGRLCYRQVVVSIPRQQGKSLLGAILGLYGLLFHYKDSYVVGVASSKEQATIIYQRVLAAIANTPALKRQFARLTDTRGIANKTGTKRYELKASKGAALQGIPLNLALFDELHISKPELWSAVVLGTTTFSDGLTVGITTAGDDNSKLLKDLYSRGEEAIKGARPRFGFFVWESPTDELTEQNVLLSNPAVECGRVSLEDVMNDLTTMPVSEAVRYRLNRFVAASNPWLAPDVWARALGPSVSPTGAFVAIDRTPNWTNASVAAVQRGDVLHGELVASFTTPTQASLHDYAKTLYKHNPTFVMDNYSLKPLVDAIRADGQTVIALTSGDVVNACQRTYALLQTNKLTHAGDPLLTHQSMRAVTKAVGTHWRVVRGSTDIDSLMAFIFAVYAADSVRPKEIQLF